MCVLKIIPSVNFHARNENETRFNDEQQETEEKLDLIFYTRFCDKNEILLSVKFLRDKPSKR